MMDQKIFQTHLQLSRLRAVLYQALEAGDAAKVQEVSAKIDDYQMKRWQEQNADKQCTG